MPALTKEQWIEARRDWEGGLSQSKLAQKYGVSVPTITDHKNKDGWVRMGEPATVPAEVFPEVQEATQMAELQAELERLRAERDNLEVERDSLKRDVRLELPRDVEGVIRFFTREHIESIALDRFNKVRRDKGFNPLELLSGDKTLEAEVQKVAAQILKRQTSWAGESNLRTLKMAKVNPEAPTGYSITAIPMEPTINNFTVNPREAIARYERKGYKLIHPQLCQRGPCYAPCPYEGGRLKFQGYCSEEHMMADPFINAKQRGVSTTAVSMTSGMDLAAAVSR